MLVSDAYEDEKNNSENWKFNLIRSKIPNL